MVGSDRSVNMQKWGIPEDESVSAEFTLLERLVWVPYKDHWWPALLYTGYSELQAHLYDELDMTLKAQFAVAIMRQMNGSKPIKVARLLGREVLEVVEVDDTQYAEFYWQLPKVLPMACKKSRYGGDTQLYIDFHRALDQVEEIIRDISQNSFNLVPMEEKKTWVQRAEEAMKNSNGPSFRYNNNSIQGSFKSQQRQKDADDGEEINFLFSALDGIMENLNNTYDCMSGETSAKILQPEAEILGLQGEDRTTISRMNVNLYSSPMTRQRETRENLRKAISKQRMIRQSGSGGSTDCVAVSESRDEPSEVKKSSSTEVLPGLDADDIIPGITQTGIWDYFTPEKEVNAPEYSTQLPLRPSNVGMSRSQSRDRGDYEPELMDVMPQKRGKVITRRDEVERSIPHYQSIDSREDDYTHTDHDSEAVKAAARAVASLELETSFWHTMTCHAMDH